LSVALTIAQGLVLSLALLSMPAANGSPGPASDPASTAAPGWSAQPASAGASDSTLAPGTSAPPGSSGARGSLESNPFFQHARARISRLSVVSPELVRGGRPDSGALYFLKRAGIKTIINLRDLKGKLDAEESEAKAMGLNYINIPMSHSERVANSAIHKFLSVVKNPRMQPVYVHCQQGADRTGCMVAIYRMDRQGWGPTKAYQEMLSFNFHPILRNLTASVYEFGARMGRYEPMPPIEDAVSDLMRRAQWLMDNI
jgi:protein tyrosine/serine phosphatase